MSIKSLVKEYVSIKDAEEKLRQRKYDLKYKIGRTNIGTGIEIIDGVVWKIVWGNGEYEIRKIGKVNSEG
jgi:hypothetical protein